MRGCSIRSGECRFDTTSDKIDEDCILHPVRDTCYDRRGLQRAIDRVGALVDRPDECSYDQIVRDGRITDVRLFDQWRRFIGTWGDDFPIRSEYREGTIPDEIVDRMHLSDRFRDWYTTDRVPRTMLVCHGRQHDLPGRPRDAVYLDTDPKADPDIVYHFNDSVFNLEDFLPKLASHFDEIIFIGCPVTAFYRSPHPLNIRAIHMSRELGYEGDFGLEQLLERCHHLTRVGSRLAFPYRKEMDSIWYHSKIFDPTIGEGEALSRYRKMFGRFKDDYAVEETPVLLTLVRIR
jgi:hypothetical protein